MDVYVHCVDIVVINIVGDKVHAGDQDVRQVLDFIGLQVCPGQIDADDNVGPHLAGDVNREIVAHAAVREHHSVVTDRGEKAWDAHGGAHGQVDGTVVPYLGLSGRHVRGHAGERDGELEEVRGIRITHRTAGDDLVHVLAKHKTGRQASH